MEIDLAIAARARSGSPLTAAELDELGTADILSLGMLADEVRRARLGTVVTYARVHEMRSGADAVPDSAGEVRLVGLPATIEATEAAVLVGRQMAEGRLLSGFSLAELADRAEGGWGPLGQMLSRLKAAGLDAIAEAPVDLMTDAGDPLQAAADTGLPVRCLSVQRPLAEPRSAILIRVRTLGARFPALRTFDPLPREQSVTLPTTGYEDVRAVALSRLALPAMPNIQVNWAHYGPKLAQVALTFGASDIDRVSGEDDESLGRRRTSVEDVRRNIVAAGFTPVERDVRR